MAQNTRTFADALARLDADIETAEARVADLRLKRQGVQDFLTEYFVGDDVPSSTSITGSGQSAIVQQVITDHNLSDFTIELVDRHAQADGHKLSREQINNGVTYLKRKGFIEKRPGRGNWRRVSLINADGPTEVGPSEQDPAPLILESANG